MPETPAPLEPVVTDEHVPDQDPVVQGRGKKKYEMRADGSIAFFGETADEKVLAELAAATEKGSEV